MSALSSARGTLSSFQFDGHLPSGGLSYRRCGRRPSHAVVCRGTIAIPFPPTDPGQDTLAAFVDYVAGEAGISPGATWVDVKTFV